MAIRQKGVDKIAVTHVFAVINGIAIVRHAQHDKFLPCFSKSNSSDGASVQRLDVVQSIGTLVFEGVSVGVSFKTAIAVDFQKLCSSEQAVIWDVFEFTFLQKFCSTTLTSRNYISGVPCKFVMPQIIITFGGYKSTCKRFKKNHLATFGLDAVYDLHGTHMIDTWIDAHFI